MRHTSIDHTSVDLSAERWPHLWIFNYKLYMPHFSHHSMYV